MQRIRERLTRLYGADHAARNFERLAMMVGRYGVGYDEGIEPRRWDERDTILITYGDMVARPGEPPLATLGAFAERRLRDALNTIHLLPFFPDSSDDGFAVIDYRKVHAGYGSWEDVRALGKRFHLMFDLVLNHVSARSTWFREFVSGVAPYRDYFIAVDPGTDLSMVVRPRVSPLLRKVNTRDGERYVWTTFSDDQIDLNFANEHVLFEFIDILFFYMARGARIIRLDAIAYLWKELGTPCIHLPQTHEVVKLLRDIVEMVAPHVLLLTETNVPHDENVRYFGQGDEAHMVYQFTLPPLLLHALQQANTRYLTAWAAELPAPPPGCTFLNFTASHDGIGVRPLEGILPPREIEELLEGVIAKGGFVSSKTNADGTESPYELNITYYEALGEPGDRNSDLHVARFLCSQAVVLALRGIPAVYFNSLIAAENNRGGVEFTGIARTINREKWNADELDKRLDNNHSVSAKVFERYVMMLKTRKQHPAFHPDGEQRILSLGDPIFALERTAPDGSETLVSVSNFTPNRQEVEIAGRVPSLAGTNRWKELISGRTRGRGKGVLQLAPYETCWLLAAPQAHLQP